MNKLQKLLESKIPFKLTANNELDGFLGWILELMPRYEKIVYSQTKFFDEAIEQLWQAAKKHYPEAECFKEEREEG